MKVKLYSIRFVLVTIMILEKFNSLALGFWDFSPHFQFEPYVFSIGNIMDRF